MQEEDLNLEVDLLTGEGREGAADQDLETEIEEVEVGEERPEEMKIKAIFQILNGRHSNRIRATCLI